MSERPIYVPCGFQSFCGRPDHHRGHHGGWRTGVQLQVKPEDRYISYNGSPYRPGDMVPPRALAIIAEYICHGGFKEAAECLDLSLQTVKNHAASAIATTKATSTANAAFRLGWVKFPQGVGHVLDCRNWEGDGI